MDHFEQELARMLRDSHQETPYEGNHRRRLQAGVRARQRSRTAWMALGSVLTITGLGVVLMVLSGPFAQGDPAGPQPRPVTSAESVSAPPTARPASSAQGVPAPTYTSSGAPVPVPYRP
ncbi:hypothetical protein [Streptomyces sp. NPDC020489]|uniref:hypothetical protein n=1 Tax=Streptomyces sp. NPDC020489 TaxID=3365077 RepID=UPI0037899E1F